MNRYCLSTTSGITSVTVLLILIVVAALYLGYLFAPPYIDYYQARQEVQSAAYRALRSDDDDLIRNFIIQEFEANNIQLTKRDIEIKRTKAGRNVTVIVYYDVQVRFIPTSYTHTLHFAPMAEVGKGKWY